VTISANPARVGIRAVRDKEFLFGAHSDIKGVDDMFATIAAVLIVLWLLGLLAFHVSSGLIHILLVVGIVMLLLHFFRGRAATA
jgi:hypothetical protein